jgi:hypothetical protein
MACRLQSCFSKREAGLLFFGEQHDLIKLPFSEWGHLFRHMPPLAADEHSICRSSENFNCLRTSAQLRSYSNID